MKGKGFLTRILACSLSFLMFLTVPADMVSAQNKNQKTEDSTENLELQAASVVSGKEGDLNWSIL